jgi:hypothetical protein
MKQLRARSLAFALISGAALIFVCEVASQEAAPEQAPAQLEPSPPIAKDRGSLRAEDRLAFVAELAAAPLCSLGPEFRGCEIAALGGIAFRPFELGLRASGAYDPGLASWEGRLDLCLGMGSGLRAIVGGLLLPDTPALVGADGAAVAASLADWPNRFGIGARIAGLPWRPLGASMSLDAELLYTAYRLVVEDGDEAQARLAGAAAFAAGVEAKLGITLAWGREKDR